jgi:isatin hydrolase
MTSEDTAASGLATALAGATWIDLSLMVSERHPVWPRHMPFQHKVWNWYEDPALPGQTSRSDEAYYTGWWTIDEHVGTHFDAPSHYIPPPGSGLPDAGPAGALSGEQMPLAAMHGPARVLDAPALDAGPGVSPAIGADVLAAHEREHGRVAEGDVMLLRSGWDRRYQPGPAGRAYSVDVLEGRSAGWPAPTAELVLELTERGVKLLGTDGVSIGMAHDGRPAHVAGLARGMWYVEGLAGLSALPPRGAYFVFLPVKVEGSSGGPGRAVGLVPGR